MIESALFADLRHLSLRWEPDPRITETGTRGGEQIPVGFGAPLWRGVMVLKSLPPRAMARTEAILAELALPGRFPLVHDPRHCGPALDPGGVILGAAEPEIMAVESNAREMSLEGLPAGYGLRAGDWIGWQYGTNPVRYAMHRLLSDADADGSGETGLFSVTPPIRPGDIVGAAVTLVRPQIKCRVRTRAGLSGALVEGTEITFIQTLR